MPAAGNGHEHAFVRLEGVDDGGDYSDVYLVLFNYCDSLDGHSLCLYSTIRKRLNDVTIRVPVRQGRQGDSMGGREWER